MEDKNQYIEEYIRNISSQVNSKYSKELIDFYLKKYNEIKNSNITKEQFLNWMEKTQSNLSEFERMVVIYNDFKNNLSLDEKNKVFECFKKIDNNIKSEDDFTVLCQNTRLKMNVMSNLEEKMNQNGKVITIPANSERGFNYPFMIYIPNSIDVNNINNLLFHCCNTPYDMLDTSKNMEYTKLGQLQSDSLQLEMSNKGNVPLIMPIIPRFRGYNPEYIENGMQRGSLENFIYLQNELDPKYQMSKEQIEYEFNKSQNILDQQLKMCDYAISYLKSNGIQMDNKIIVEGHSAGSKTAASLINKYPDRIDSYVIGGTTGIAEVNDKSIPGLIYNGVLDTNNPAEFYFDEKGVARSKNLAAYSDKYVKEVIVPRYNKSLEDWKKENPNKDVKEFNVVQYDIKKQSQRFGDKSLLVENCGHNAISSPEVRQKAVEVVKNTKKKNNKYENNIQQKSRKEEINNLKKLRFELTQKQIHNTIQKKKEKVKTLKLNNNSKNGFINIMFSSIIAIILGLILFMILKLI